MLTLTNCVKLWDSVQRKTGQISSQESLVHSMQMSAEPQDTVQTSCLQGMKPIQALNTC